MGFLIPNGFSDEDIGFAVTRCRRALMSTIELAKPRASRLLAGLHGLSEVDNTILFVRDVAQIVTIMSPLEARQYCQQIPSAHHLLGKLGDTTGSAVSRVLLNALDRWWVVALPSFEFRRWARDAMTPTPTPPREAA